MLRERGENQFLLDSARPQIPLADYSSSQLRFTALTRTDPDQAARPAALAQHAVELRWETYEEMATRQGHGFPADARPSPGRGPGRGMA